MSTSLSTPEPDDGSANKFTDAIMKFLGRIPTTSQAQLSSPGDKARQIANAAAIKAATSAGALAIPPGPLGWATILPEIVTVWKIQSQMVADLAGVYGKTKSLSQGQMLYCLFRHGSAMAVRDIVVRVGDRYLVRQLSRQALKDAANRIGIRISQKAAAKTASRWLPVIGALGVGGYAYYDTARIANTAIDMFQSEIILEEDPESPVISDR